MPAPEFLRNYTCSMCEAEFRGTTEERLFTSHFKTFHSAKKMKAVYVERACRLCGHDECANDKELVRRATMTFLPAAHKQSLEM